MNEPIAIGDVFWIMDGVKLRKVVVIGPPYHYFGQDVVDVEWVDPKKGTTRSIQSLRVTSLIHRTPQTAINAALDKVDADIRKMEAKHDTLSKLLESVKGEVNL